MNLVIVVFALVIFLIICAYLLVQHLKRVQQEREEIAQRLGLDFVQRPDLIAGKLLSEISIINAGRKPFASNLFRGSGADFDSFHFDYSRALGQGSQQGAMLRPVALFRIKSRVLPKISVASGIGAAECPENCKAIVEELLALPLLKQVRLKLHIDGDWVLFEAKKTSPLKLEDWIQQTCDVASWICKMTA